MLSPLHTLNRRRHRYAFSMILWCLLTGRHEAWIARNGEHPHDLYVVQRVQQGERPPCRNDLRRDAPAPLVQLMTHAWAQRPGDRPRALEALEVLEGLCATHEVPVPTAAVAPRPTPAALSPQPRFSLRAPPQQLQQQRCKTPDPEAAGDTPQRLLSLSTGSTGRSVASASSSCGVYTGRAADTGHRLQGRDSFTVSDAVIVDSDGAADETPARARVDTGGDSRRSWVNAEGSMSEGSVSAEDSSPPQQSTGPVVGRSISRRWPPVQSNVGRRDEPAGRSGASSRSQTSGTAPNQATTTGTTSASGSSRPTPNRTFGI